MRIFASALYALVVLSPSLAFSQSVVDGFDPSVTGDAVRAVAVQPDGKVVLGGLFTAVSGIARTNLARVHPDGTLDISFDPRPNDTIRCLAVQPDGGILVGGDFTAIAGVERSHLARFNADGSLDAEFDPAPNGTVYSIAVQLDGRIVIGGSFASVAGEARPAAARLGSNGTLDPVFNPGADNTVYTVAIQADGRIMLGGSFAILGGTTRRSIGRLNVDGTVDETFNPVANGFTPESGGTVFSIVPQMDGKIVVGGSFVTADAHSRTNFARLNTDGTVDVTFNHWVRGTVRCLALQADATIVVGGLFHSVNSVLSLTFTNLARFRTDGVVDDGFKARPNFGVSSLALQRDEKIIVGGEFNVLANGGRRRIARLHPNLRLDTTFIPTVGQRDAGQNLLAVAVQPDGKILVGASSTNQGGAARAALARLHPDGTVDATFSADRVDGIGCLALQRDGKILVGAGVRMPGASDLHRMGRLNADGSLDASFDPRPDRAVYCVAIQPDGKILITGMFTSIAGLSRPRIARLNTDGSLDTSFNPVADRQINTLAVQSDGKILLGGFFTTLNGQPRNLIGRLNPDGSLDSFDPGAGGTDGSFSPPNVNTVAVQADGKVLVGGWFTQLGGRSRGFLGRTHADGRLDETFVPGFPLNPQFSTASICLQVDGKISVASDSTSSTFESINLVRFNNSGGLETDFNGGARGGLAGAPRGVYGLAVQADGKSVAIGNFSSLGGQLRVNIGRFNSQSHAIQSLEINSSGTVATWSRSGSCAEVEQVTLEQSIDGTNFTFIGHASRTNDGWRLEGHSLPTGISFWLRAQGRTIGSRNNGSSGLSESVAQFWRLPPPFIASVQVLGGSVFQFSFTNTNTAAFSVLASTNAAAPAATWENLGPPVSVGGGLYQFTDPAAANHSRRFYQLRTP